MMIGHHFGCICTLIGGYSLINIYIYFPRLFWLLNLFPQLLFCQHLFIYASVAFGRHRRRRRPRLRRRRCQRPQCHFSYSPICKAITWGILIYAISTYAYSMYSICINCCCGCTAKGALTIAANEMLNTHSSERS